MVVQIWEGIITRQYKFNRLPMNFEDYTDWLSDKTEGRLNELQFIKCLSAVKRDGTIEPLVNHENEYIGVVKHDTN